MNFKNITEANGIILKNYESHKDAMYRVLLNKSIKIYLQLKKLAKKDCKKNFKDFDWYKNNIYLNWLNIIRNIVKLLQNNIFEQKDKILMVENYYNSKITLTDIHYTEINSSVTIGNDLSFIIGNKNHFITMSEYTSQHWDTMIEITQKGTIDTNNKYFKIDILYEKNDIKGNWKLICDNNFGSEFVSSYISRYTEGERDFKSKKKLGMNIVYDFDDDTCVVKKLYFNLNENYHNKCREILYVKGKQHNTRNIMYNNGEIVWYQNL